MTGNIGWSQRRGVRAKGNDRSWRGSWMGTPKGTSGGTSNRIWKGGLAVKLRLGKVQVRSGPGLVQFTAQI